MKYHKLLELGERVVGGFIYGFIAVYFAAFAAGQSDIAFLRDPDLFDKAKAAGVVAALSLAKGLVGFRVGDKDTASIITVKKPETEVSDQPFTYFYKDDSHEG